LHKWARRIIAVAGALIILAAVSLCIYPWGKLLGGRPMFCHWSWEGFNGSWLRNLTIHDEKHCWVYFDDELCILLVLITRHQGNEYPIVKTHPEQSVFDVNSHLVNVNSDEASRLIILYDAGTKVEFVLEPKRYWEMKNQILDSWENQKTDSLAESVAALWDGPGKELCKQVLGVK
jgi:hypothetical protein